MSPGSNWFAQDNAMSPIGTNPRIVCTSSLSLQGSITIRDANLHKNEDPL